MVGRSATLARESRRMKKRERTNGLLAVEVFSAECYFQAKPKAKSVDIADFMAALAKTLHTQGYSSADIFLDNNPTHKNKMKTAFYEQLEVPITVRCASFP